MKFSDGPESPETAVLLGFAQEVAIDYLNGPSRPLFPRMDLGKFEIKLKGSQRVGASPIEY
jgi:hypothetical protein